MGFEFLIMMFAQLPAGRSRAVLDQVSPDVFLVSSKADDRFIDLCSDSGTNLPWAARYIICVRPPWHSFFSISFFFGSGCFWGLLPDTPAKGFQTGEGAQQPVVAGPPVRPSRRDS